MAPTDDRYRRIRKVPAGEFRARLTGPVAEPAARLQRLPGRPDCRGVLAVPIRATTTTWGVRPLAVYANVQATVAWSIPLG